MTKKGSGDERNCHGVVGYEEGQIRCNLCEKIFESMKLLYFHLKGTDHDESDWKTFFEKGSSSGETVGSTSKAELKWARTKRLVFPSQLQAYGGAPNVRAPDIVELPEAVVTVDRHDQLRLDPRVVPNVRDGLRSRAQDDVDSPRPGKRVCLPGLQSDHHGGVVDMRDYFRFDPDYEEVLEAAETLMLMSMSEPKKVEHEEVVEGCHRNDRGARGNTFWWQAE